ncbi:MAG: hypothetical protein WDN04_08260, partial [Rhodospirillales bacterium]
MPESVTSDIGSEGPKSSGPEAIARRGRANGRPVDTDDHSVLSLDELLDALQSMRGGDFSVRLPGNLVGRAGKIADTFNDIVSANERMAGQLENVGQVVGREGKTRTRVKLGVGGGAWAEMETSINTLMDDLLWPTTAVTHTIAAVAKGDLLQDRYRWMSTAGRYRASSCGRHPLSIR